MYTIYPLKRRPLLQDPSWKANGKKTDEWTSHWNEIQS
jgi:hypothetical protein